MSKQWTKQKCHSAGQRNDDCDDDDDDDVDDDDDDDDDWNQYLKLHGRYLTKPVSNFFLNL